MTTTENWTPKFDDRLQRLFVAFLIQDQETLETCHPFLQPEHFTNEMLRGLVQLTVHYFDQYHEAPGDQLLPLIEDLARNGHLPETRANLLTTAAKELLQEKLTSRAFILDKYDGILKHIVFAPALLKAAELGKRGEYDGALQHLQQELDKTPRGKPAPALTPSDLMKTQPLEFVFDGFLRVRECGEMNAPPKLGKTWAANQMAVCKALGLPFLGYTCRPGRVRYFDYEMIGNDVGFRLRKLCAALGIESDEDMATLDRNLRIDLLRGHPERDLNWILQQLNRDGPGAWDLVIIDSRYKAMLEGWQENSNDDVGRYYGMLQGSATINGFASMTIHHQSKGNHSDKATTDIGAGGSAAPRAVDTFTVLLPHDDCVGGNRVAVVRLVVKGIPPIDDFVIEHRDLLWVRDSTRSAKDAKKQGEKRMPSVAEVVSNLPRRPDDLADAKSYGDILTMLYGLLHDCAQVKIKSTLRRAIDEGWAVEVSCGSKKRTIYAASDYKIDIPEPSEEVAA